MTLSFVRVNSKWIAMHPYGRMDALYWARVVEVASQKGIDLEDKIQLMKVILEVEEDFKNDRDS